MPWIPFIDGCYIGVLPGNHFPPDGHRALEEQLGRVFFFRGIVTGAPERIRTSTPLRAHGPEPCVSASSTTGALWTIPLGSRTYD